MTRNSLAVVALLSVLPLAGCTSGKRSPGGKTSAEWSSVRARVKTQLAADQLAAGNVQEAAAALREARGLDASNPALSIMQAQVELSAGETDKAEQTLARVQVSGKGRAEVEYLYGVIWQQRQRWATALEHFSRAAQLDPEDASYPAAAAQVLLQTGQAAQAVLTLEQVRQRFEWLPTWQTSMAEALEQTGKWSDAAVLWRKLAGDGEDPVLLERLGYALQRAQRWEEAAAALGQLWQRLEDAKQPDQPGIARSDVALALANCLLELGQTPAAIEALRHVLSGEPRHVAAQRQLALALARSGETAPALQAAEAALRGSPKDPLSLELVAALGQRAGQYARAVAVARQLPADNPVAQLVLTENAKAVRADSRP